jgi:hypothetical protein
LAFFTVCAIPAHAGPPREATGPSVSEFLTPDGRFDLVAARNSRHEGPLHLAGFESHFDAETGELLFSPKSSPRSPDDVNWWDGFRRPGVDGRVKAIAIYDEDVVVAGEFTCAGDSAANRIARWDGIGWYPLGGGLDDIANALVVYAGDLVAAGRFLHAGGSVANRVAAWDGNEWHALGGGTNGEVLALEVYDGALIAGGYFTQAGETTANHVAAWDGDSWSPLGDGISGGYESAHIRALTVFSETLIAGGDFTQAGDTTASCVASWDGATWAPLGQGMEGIPIPCIHPLVCGLKVHDGTLIAGGRFYRAGESAVSHIARWDGSSWDSIGSGMRAPYGPETMPVVLALGTCAGDLVAGGYFTQAGDSAVNFVARWDGSHWRPLGEGVWWSGCGVGDYARVHALLEYDGCLFVGGDISQAAGIAADGIASWSGGEWAYLGDSGMGLDCYVHALAVYNGALVAGGDFSIYVPGDSLYEGWYSKGIAQWDGSSWRALGPGLSGRVSDFAYYMGDLIAVGDFTRTAIGGDLERVGRWDGHSWSPLGDSSTGRLYAVTVYDGDVVVGGSFHHIGDVEADYVARWDGSSWHSLDSGMYNIVTALGVYDGELIAGGVFEQAGGMEARHIARWDGSTWRPLGAGTNSIVNELAVYDGLLYVGGGFNEAGGVPVSGIARWDGSTWSPVGSCVNHSVLAMMVFGGDLIVAGRFTEAGGSPANRIARWDGASWSTFGSGLGPYAHALVDYDGDLFVGGRFLSAGNKKSCYIARWTAPSTRVSQSDPSRSSLQLEPNYPNPFNPSTTIRFSVRETAPVSLTIYDVTGRRVKTLVDGTRESGDHSVNWNGMEEGGSRVAAGVYFARLECGGEVRTTKVVLAK